MVRVLSINKDRFFRESDETPTLVDLGICLLRGSSRFCSEIPRPRTFREASTDQLFGCSGFGSLPGIPTTLDVRRLRRFPQLR